VLVYVKVADVLVVAVVWEGPLVMVTVGAFSVTV
jgi:hypothetical protein